jgi:hypothetical protein
MKLTSEQKPVAQRILAGMALTIMGLVIQRLGMRLTREAVHAWPKKVDEPSVE